MGYIQFPIDIHIPELEVLVADVQQLVQDVRGLKTDLAARFDAIDGVIEDLRQQVQSGQLDEAALDQLKTEIQGARAQVDEVDPEDPSGDDPVAPTAAGGDASVDAEPADGGTPLDPATGQPVDNGSDQQDPAAPTA